MIHRLLVLDGHRPIPRGADVALETGRTGAVSWGLVGS
jgi:hypothetical protein